MIIENEQKNLLLFKRLLSMIVTIQPDTEPSDTPAVIHLYKEEKVFYYGTKNKNDC